MSQFTNWIARLSFIQHILPEHLSALDTGPDTWNTVKSEPDYGLGPILEGDTDVQQKKPTHRQDNVSAMKGITGFIIDNLAGVGFWGVKLQMELLWKDRLRVIIYCTSEEETEGSIVAKVPYHILNASLSYRSLFRGSFLAPKSEFSLLLLYGDDRLAAGFGLSP